MICRGRLLAKLERMERRADTAEDKLRAPEEKRVSTAAQALSKKNRTQERRIQKLTEGTKTLRQQLVRQQVSVLDVHVRKCSVRTC